MACLQGTIAAMLGPVMGRPSTSDSSEGFARRAKFQETLWGQVFAAGKQDSAGSQEAMARLYETYWLPIYSFLRRSGHDHHKAKEVAQDFFGYLWQQKLLAKADPDRGRFRNFLIGVLKRYVRGEQRRTLKGGAGCHIVSIDAESAEGIYANEPATQETPETIFERHWVIKVLEQARERLRGELAETHPEIFELVEPCLTGENEERFASLGKKLGKAEGATRTFVSRLRARHRALILEVISDTLANKEDAEQEFQHLVAILRGSK